MKHIFLISFVVTVEFVLLESKCWRLLEDLIRRLFFIDEWISGFIPRFPFSSNHKAQCNFPLWKCPALHSSAFTSILRNSFDENESSSRIYFLQMGFSTWEKIDNSKNMLPCHLIETTFCISNEDFVRSFSFISLVLCEIECSESFAPSWSSSSGNIVFH